MKETEKIKQPHEHSDYERGIVDAYSVVKKCMDETKYHLIKQGYPNAAELMEGAWGVIMEIGYDTFGVIQVIDEKEVN